MIRLRHTLLLGLLALFTTALPAQEAATPAQQPAEQADSVDLSPDALAELDPEVQLALVYSVGVPQLFQNLQSLLIEAERARREEQGVDLSYAVVSEFDIERRIEETIHDFVEKNPDLDFWAQVEASGYTREAYRREIRRNLEMEKLFFPSDLERWPVDRLVEIFGGEEDEQSLWNQMVKNLPAELQKQRDAGEPGEIQKLTMQMFLRPQVFRWLMDNSEIVYPFDGLPEGVCLRVDGRDVATTDLLRSIAGAVSDVELHRARKFVELCRGLEADLQTKGVLLTREETQAIIDEEKVDYEGSYITYEQVALEFMGFPSMELYKRWKLLRESFRKTLPDPFDEATLDAHLEKRRQFIANGQVTAEVILISAKDLDTGLWPKKGSFAAAKKRTEPVIEALLAGREWGEVLTEFSEYPERTRGSQPQMPQPQRGRFGPQMRNPLRQFLGENDYTDFLLGNSLADFLFFDAEPGAVYNPRRGPYGYYFVKLVKRSEPKAQIDWRNNDRQAYFVKDDYLSVQFLDYIADVMSDER